MGYFKVIGGISSPFFQSYETTKEEHESQDPYWYKIDGKRVSRHIYCEYENKPGQMEGGGKTTNNPDPCGIKAKHAADRANLPRKHTVLTEEQMKNKPK